MFVVFAVGIYRMLFGSYKNPANRVLEKMALKTSENTYTIFKQSSIANTHSTGGVYFEIEFKFKDGVPKIFSPTVPFFVGMPGFVSKLWLIDENTGTYAGQYVFAREEDAVGYGNSAAQKLVRSLCVKDHYHWKIIKIKHNENQ